VNVTYYSGLQQPNVLPSYTQYNGYVRIGATGGSGFTYDLSVIADSAIYGNVNNAAASRLAVYNTPYWALLSSSSSSVSGLLSTTSSVGANRLSGDYTGTDQNNALPVTLTAFSATAAGKDVVLNWSTQSEFNNEGFEIERSLNNSYFESIGFVKGQDNSQKQANYVSVDKAAFSNTGATVLYYRLKQLDKDGHYNYSRIAVVSLSANENDRILAYPNPFNNTSKLVLQSAKEGMALITLTDISGKTLFTKTLPVSANTNTFELEELTDLHSGVYFLTSTVNGQAHMLKLVKAE
jgi:hypothetical protein